MPQTALVAAFLAGLVGGLHCLAMCGGYVGALGAAPSVARVVPLAVLRRQQLAAQAGRLSTYALLGALFGAVGGAALSRSLGSALTALYVVANLMLLALAVAIARGGAGFAWLERAGLALYSRLIPAVGPLSRGGGLAPRFGLGLVWGLTPCGLVYGVLPVAALAGGAADGALVMLAFGLGTLPNLLAAGYVAARARPLLASKAMRAAVALAIAGFAVFGLWRAIAMPGPLAHGPFCVVP